MDEQNWLNQRKARFTASQIYKLFTEPSTKADKEAGLLSKTAKDYIIEVAIEQLTGYRKEISGVALDHGNQFEQEAFNAFKELTGLDFDFTGNVFYPLGENSGASPDGVEYDGLDVVSVADVKCPWSPISFYNQKMMMNSDSKYQGVPVEYFYQVQLQMLSTGANKAYLVRYLADRTQDKFGNTVEYNLPPENRIFYKIVYSDKDVQSQILSKIAKADEYRKQVIQEFLTINNK